MSSTSDWKTHRLKPVLFSILKNDGVGFVVMQSHFRKNCRVLPELV